MSSLHDKKILTKLNGTQDVLDKEYEITDSEREAYEHFNGNPSYGIGYAPIEDLVAYAWNEFGDKAFPYSIKTNVNNLVTLLEWAQLFNLPFHEEYLKKCALDFNDQPEEITCYVRNFLNPYKQHSEQIENCEPYYLLVQLDSGLYAVHKPQVLVYGMMPSWVLTKILERTRKN